MAIEKFKFVSPGVQVNEIDDSVIQPIPPAVGPVVIGNTVKGPSMEPVQVSSVAELERVFGKAHNGNVGATDVWRSGAPTAPTLATYAAKAYLTNGSPVTVIRLAGAPMADGDDTTNDSSMPGWKTEKVYELYAVNSGSTNVTGALAAVIYSSGTLGLSGSEDPNIDNLFVTGSGGACTVTGSDFSMKETFTFDSSKESFVRNVLNTNPTRYSTDKYFIGETFENTYSSSLNAPVTHFALKEITTTAHKKFFNEKGAQPARTGVVVSRFSNPADSSSYTELFHFETLEKGSTPPREIKVSIENVRVSKNPNVTKYGSFDVIVRSLYDSASSSVLERFAGVNLDPNSDNYIVKRIGDVSRSWDPDQLRYSESGTFSNKSSYIRVVMSGQDISPTALPAGFRKPKIPVAIVSGVNKVIRPDIQTVAKVSKASAKTKRFGLVADSNNNTDLVDILRFHPARDYSIGDIFSTDYISLVTNDYTYGSSIQSSNVMLEGKIAGFDMPFYDGFDAKNITELEPFVNDSLLQDATSLNNPAYRAILQALNMVAQAELIDMNVLCVPGLQNEDLTSNMIDLCRTRGDSLALIDLKGDYLYPHDTTDRVESRPVNTSDVINTLKERKIDNSYGAAYFPAVFVPSEGIFMPASVAALGALAGNDSRTALWFAPAGFNRGGLTEGSSGLGVSRTALHLVSSDRDDLYDSNINPIATFPNEGVVIFGQKTLQVTQSALDRVNVRRLLNHVKKYISRAATRVLFEPNIQRTWDSFKSVVDPFLLSIKNGYGLEDAKIVLDSSTTTADLIDRNVMYCKVYIKPTRAIEYIGIDFVVTNSGASFSE